MVRRCGGERLGALFRTVRRPVGAIKPRKRNIGHAVIGVDQLALGDLLSRAANGSELKALAVGFQPNDVADVHARAYASAGTRTGGIFGAADSDLIALERSWLPTGWVSESYELV